VVTLKYGSEDRFILNKEER